jgi:flavin reductase ActVB
MNDQGGATTETTVPADRFRAALAHFATGVVVVTTTDSQGAPHGLTATSFCSVSLDPALILVCVAEAASSFRAFASCGEFAVSILRQENAAAARRFAQSGADKFRPEDMALTPRMLPVVSEALCCLDCRIHDRHRAGDHLIVVGAVTGVRVGAGAPLIYYKQSFRTLHSIGGAS